MICLLQFEFAPRHKQTNHFKRISREELSKNERRSDFAIVRYNVVMQKEAENLDKSNRYAKFNLTTNTWTRQSLLNLLQVSLLICFQFIFRPDGKSAPLGKFNLRSWWNFSGALSGLKVERSIIRARIHKLTCGPAEKKTRC